MIRPVRGKTFIVSAAILLLTYLSYYHTCRLTGIVGNTNYFLNNYYTDSKLAHAICPPGCVVENLITYTVNFGWSGTRMALTDLRFSLLPYEDAPISFENTIYWWQVRARVPPMSPPLTSH